MGTLVVVLRLVHVVAGILWVGFAVFMLLVLGPAMERMGPDGGKVMAAIGPRLHTMIMPLVAVLSMVSGVWLYWIVSGGFSPAYVHSHMGMVFGLGGLAAISTFVIGLTVIRPAMSRAMALGASLGSAPSDQQAAIAAEAKRFRDRVNAAGRIGTGLLVLAAICMAVARYL